MLVATATRPELVSGSFVFGASPEWLPYYMQPVRLWFMTIRTRYWLVFVLQFVALVSIIKAIQSMYGSAYSSEAPSVGQAIWLFGSVVVGLIAAVLVIYYRGQLANSELNQQKVATETLAKLGRRRK